MMEEVGSPRRSPGWKPHSTYAGEMGLTEGGKLAIGHHGEKAHLASETGHHAGDGDVDAPVSTTAPTHIGVDGHRSAV